MNRQIKDPATEPFGLRVMTYNIFAGRNYNDGNQVNVTAMGKVMQTYHPDIIGLNEVLGEGKLKDIFTNQTKTLGNMLGFHGYFAKALDFDWGGPFGNALLSRFPILSAETIPIEDPPLQDENTLYQTRCLLKATLDVPGGLTVYVSHFGLANSEKENAIKRTLELIQTEKNPFILMGDFNMLPNDTRWQPILAFVKDTAPHGTDAPHTFPSDKPDRKIDYIFVSDHFRVISVCAPDETVSDHKPYIADLIMV